MSDELKPCPLCGGPVLVHRRTDGQVDGIVCDECLLTLEAVDVYPEWHTLDELVLRWNARAAVTDEQFAMAVHDGEAWQRVRTCRPTPSIMNDVEHIVVQRVGSSEFQLKWPYQRCSECSADFPEGSRYCPGCGAKVVAE